MRFPKKYRQGLIVSLILVAALSILFYNLRHPEPGLPRKTVLEVLFPLESAVNVPLKGLIDVWNRYIFLVGLAEKNGQLQAQNSFLREELVKYREGYQEAIRLRSLLKLNESLPYSVLAARVTARNPSSLFKLIIINRGERDGLRAGLPVLASPGVAGRVLETSWHTSRVLLMIDENSNIDAILQESRTHGILQGASPFGCRLKYIAKTVDVKVGEVVVSAGLGGIFPKGLPLGVVRAVSKKDADIFQNIEVSPFVNTADLEEVSVILPVKGDGT